MMNSFGFHSLYNSDALPSAPAVKKSSPDKEEIFDPEKETIESRAATRPIGRLLGGAPTKRRKNTKKSKTAGKKQKSTGGKKKVSRKKTIIKSKSRYPSSLHVILNQLRSLATKSRKKTKKR
ncbi:MAG: hypothetical protein GY737_17140 [Desulfobacteraceae bacterium]|nr:hypothetical protein [Desulfobacteraceae bacterium]